MRGYGTFNKHVTSMATCAQHVAKHVMRCYVCVVPKEFTEMSSLQPKKIAHRHFKPKSFLLITEIDFPV